MAKVWINDLTVYWVSESLAQVSCHLVFTWIVTPGPIVVSLDLLSAWDTWSHLYKSSVEPKGLSYLFFCFENEQI